MSLQGVVPHFYLALNNIPLSGCTTSILFTHLPTEGCLYVLAIMNKAIISVHVQSFMWS